MDRKKRVTITLDVNLLDEFKKVCSEKDLKVSTKINSLIKEWLSNNKSNNKR